MSDTIIFHSLTVDLLYCRDSHHEEKIVLFEQHEFKPPLLGPHCLHAVNTIVIPGNHGMLICIAILSETSTVI